MSFVTTTGYSWTNGEVVTATKLNLATLPTVADNQNYAFAAGSVGAPSVSFNGDTTTGLYRFAAGQVGLAGTAFLFLNGSASNSFYVGQDSTHNMAFAWAYNATAGSASAVFGTFGKNNPLTIQASTVNIDSGSLAFAVQVVTSGRVRIGGGSDDGTNALQVNGSLAVTGGISFGGGPLPIASGGTSAGTAGGARTALGLGTIATQDASAVTITGGTVSGTTMTSNTITGGSINNTPIGASTASTVKATHFISAGSTPSIAPGAASGSGAATSISGTDIAGLITVSSGSGPATNASFADITFTTAFAAAPIVVFYPANGTATNIDQYFYATSTTTGCSLNVGPFTISFTSAQWNYHVIG